MPYGVNVTGPRRAQLWAGRTGVSARSLGKIVRATKGIGIDVLDKSMREAVERDEIGRRSRMRRQFVPPSLVDGTVVPGSHHSIDEFGPVAAPSIVDRSHIHLVSADRATGYMHDGTATTSRVDSVLDFIRSIVADEHAVGHKVLSIRIDADPKLTSPGTDGHREFERELSRIGIKLEVCAGGNHAANGDVESMQDVLTRRAEGYLARSSPALGRSHFLPARRYALHNVNRSVPRLQSKTRLELWNSAVGTPDLTRLTPLIYGTNVAYVSSSDARGPKGDLNTRSPLAQFVGIYKNSSYLLIARNGSIISRAPRDCVPLDELRRLEPDAQPPSREGVDADASSEEGTVVLSGEGVSARPYFPPTTPFEKSAPLDMRGPPASRLTRVRAPPAYYSPAVHTIEGLLSGCGSGVEVVVAFNNLAHALLGTEEPEIEISTVEGMRAGMDQLLAACGRREHTFPVVTEMNAASAPKVKIVKTKDGEKHVIIPQGTRAVLRDINCESWLDSDRRAATVLLAIPGNKLVRVDEVPDGVPIIPCVVARTFKTDRVTGFAHCSRGSALLLTDCRRRGVAEDYAQQARQGA